ncbi:MAG: hypothetical protein E6Q97_21070 [Desulfurellales bacterium]|nr:MAG: hypothetical protein E6Q97_21070 [Desulfurellales bacterium]
MGFFSRGAAEPADEPDDSNGDAYEKKKLREAERQRKISKASREIGPVPTVANPDRKARALESFRVFCESYFPKRFLLAWSEDHLKVHDDFQRCIVDGGLQATAMPRGSGKTSLAEVAAIWAIARGKHELVGLIGATSAAARELLDSIKVELESNELLAADFPEICYPIRCLEGINQRRLLLDGERVVVKFTKDYILLPSLPANPAASAVVKVAGLTGRVRGMKYTRPDGRIVRPKLVIIDDPQTDKSAKSDHQNNRREELVSGAVLGLVGPGETMSAIMPCTVIVEGDMADRFLDRTKHPEWNGRRTQLLHSLPTDLDLWDRYAEARAEGLRQGDGGKAGNAFYKKHREAMDRGAKAAWPQRHKADELSAIQYGMNLYLENRRAFFAEYQNDPKAAEEKDPDELTVAIVLTKLNGLDRGVVPAEAEVLTAFVDVHKSALYWFAGAWWKSFAGAGIDYGTWPDQKREYFTLADCRATIEGKYPHGDFQSALYSALTDLVGLLAKREWMRFGGGVGRITRILIDANWNESTDVVYQFCRQSEHSGILLPWHGRGITASQAAMKDWKPKPGERQGNNWVISTGGGARGIRHVTADVNAWKTLVNSRLAIPIGGRGAFTLFGQKAHEHRLIAEHFTAEVRVRTEGRGRKVDEWKLRPDRPDNHWFDGLVGSAVAASIEGVVMPEWAPAAPERRKIQLPKSIGGEAA